ncbi:MAG: PLP-dependent aminotransferase family protein, partial [Proteobacteria bacterium]|nr:PLP-dependent aminotransferase family protein [Pseudomonadota bacterium]
PTNIPNTIMPINDYSRIKLSWYPIKAELTPPMYLSLAAALERDIQNGTLCPGTRLPSQRDLADYLDINFTTVTRAYDLCREKKLIYGITGRGTFVSPLQCDSIQRTEALELGVVLGFPMLIDPVVAAAREILSRDYLREMFSYTNRSGMPHHIAVAVQWMRNFGVRADTAHTAVFAGAQNAITVALLSLFQLGDAIAVDRFTYANMIQAAHMAHLRLIPIAGDTSGMCPDALDLACQNRAIKGIFLMPNCANPTTITLPEDRRDALAQICQKHALTILEDDANLTPATAHRPFYARLPDQTLYIAASTRHIAPGLRVTFAAYPPKFKTPLTQGLYHTNIKASALDTEILTELIVSGNAPKLLQTKREMAVRANALFDQIFPGLPGPNDAFFRCLPLAQTNESGPELEQRMLSHGLKVCHSYRFATEKKPQSQFLRVSLASSNSLTELETALQKLKHQLSSNLK